MSRILIIDDDRAICATLALILRNAGYPVVAVEAADRGFELIRSGCFELLIVDIFMPDTDGFELIRHARTLQPDLSIIVISGMPLPSRRPSPDFLAFATELGATRSLRKPFQPKELLMAVEDCRRQALRRARGATREKNRQYDLFDREAMGGRQYAESGVR